jgi:hypothetical protein
VVLAERANGGNDLGLFFHADIGREVNVRKVDNDKGRVCAGTQELGPFKGFRVGVGKQQRTFNALLEGD